jgi:enterochelin esterase-like enzyme
MSIKKNIYSEPLKVYALRRILFLLIVLLNEFNCTYSQGSRILEGVGFYSEILQMERKYSVYLPAGYESDHRYYPVLYLLHGGGGDHTTWIQSGEVKRIADHAINEGTATPMIIVMPNAKDSIKGYYNYIKGGFDYEDFFMEELIPHIEKTYRCRTKRRYRAVAGQSMGGGGTIFYALHHPGKFAAAAPLSAVTESWQPEDLVNKLERKGIESVTDRHLEGYYQRYSIPEVLNAANKKHLQEIRSIRWYISCGDDDYLYEGNSLMHIAFRKAEIPHEFRVKDGAHNWSYWRQELPEVLHFVSLSFKEF